MAMELNLPAGYYHANLLFTGAAVPQGAAMTFGGSAASGSAATIAAAINTAWNTHLKSVFNTQCSLAGTRVKLGPTDTGPFAYVASGTAGTNVASGSAPSVAFLIRKNSALGGRQGTGRMFQPVAGENSVDHTGTVDSAFRTTLQTAYTAFFGALQSVSYPMYLLHNHGTRRSLKNGELSITVVNPRAPTEVTSLSVDSIVATQRGRLR